VLSEAEEKAKETLGWRGRAPDLHTLLLKISNKEGVEQQKVRGGDQRRSVVSVCKESILPGGGEEVGVFWGVSCAVFGGNHFVG
jgi:hypothetical protein